VPAPPLHRVRRLSFSALALFERCSYRYYAERVAGMRPTDERNAPPGTTGLAATEIGDAVHRLLELVNLQEPLPPADLVALVRGWYPRVSDEELERIAGFVRSYCESELARRVAELRGARPERPFAFEHDGVLLHGRLDVLQLDGDRALVVDYKTNYARGGHAGGDRRARLPPAAARLRARVLPRGRSEVEVVYHFLERPDAVVSTTFDAAAAGARGGAERGDRRINAGDFRPTPDEFICAAARRSTSSAPGRVCGPRSPPKRLSPRSYVHEARRRVAPKRERIRPIIERLAAAHPDATIALKSAPTSSARRRDAVGQTHGRERQPSHENVLPSTAGRRTTSPCRRRSSSATSSRPDSTGRRRRRCAARCRCCCRSSTARFRATSSSWSAARRARKTANVVAASSAIPAGSSSTHTCGGCRSGRADAQRSGQDRSAI
jgi:hypothetical protein